MPRRAAVYVAALVLTLIVWIGLSASGAVQPLLLAPPTDVWRVLVQLAGDPSGLGSSLGTTLRETAVAFGIAALTAVPLGALVGSSDVVRRAYEPVFTTLNALPLVVLYPVLAAALGIGSGSKIALGALYAFFPLAIATFRATAHVDRRLLTAARAMGASRVQRLRAVTAPAALNPVLAGARVALGLALVTVIAAEFISGAAGVGYQLGTASQSLDTPGLFAWIVIACLLTIVVNALFGLVTFLVQKGVYR